MEVAVAEEKKKIFRARKTMKISDRQQLDSLHSTLLTGTPPSSNSSSPPLLNGTHKEDGPKRLDKDQNNTTDSKSPQAASPVSPGSVGSPQPSLSLNLSPSPPCSKSPKEVAPSSPVSPFHSLNFELKKMEAESSGKKTPSTTSPADCSETASAEVNDGRDKATEVTPKLGKNEKNEEKKTAQTEKEETHAGRKEPEKDSSKDSVKDTARSSPVLPSVSVKNSEKDHRRELKYTEPMETDGDCVEVKTPEDAKAASGIEKKPASRKATNSSRSSSPRPASSSLKTPKQELKVKDEKGDKEKIKEEKDVTKGVKTGPTKEEKMQVDFVKVESKKEKTAVAGSSKQSRPSSTPPSDTGVKDRSSTSGLKRTLSEGGEQDEQKVERDGKRPKVEGVELEAQLEVKITAKAGSRVKLEKVVQQLVEERLRVLELTVFDQSLQELKDRVEKIDCATKHQTTLNMLQAKIGRLAKKFGEANQASENKKKQETLAAAVAAAAKTVATVNTPPTQRVLRRQTQEPPSGAPRGGLAPPVVKKPMQSFKQKMKIEREEKEEEEEDDEDDDEDDDDNNEDDDDDDNDDDEEDDDEEKEGNKLLVRLRMPLAERLSEHSEGKCRPDIKLRPISAQAEQLLYHNCKRGTGKPRPDRYASFLFRNLVPYDIYCGWVSKVNYVGLVGKEALPINLRKTLRKYIERRFTGLSCDCWREIRDVINEVLRVKKTPDFFRGSDERTDISFS